MVDHSEAEVGDLVSLLWVRDLARQLGRDERAKGVPKASLVRAMWNQVKSKIQ